MGEIRTVPNGKLLPPDIIVCLYCRQVKTADNGHKLCRDCEEGRSEWAQGHEERMMDEHHRTEKEESG